MKVLVACGNGSGTSLMLKRSVERAAKMMGLKLTQVHQTNISEGKNTARNFDIVFTPANFRSDFSRAIEGGIPVVGIKNVMSVDEAKAGFEANGFDA